MIFCITAIVFSFITNLSKSIGSRGSEKLNEREIKQIAPSFLWLLRDANLKPVNSEKKPCHFREYLLDKVICYKHNKILSMHI